MKPRLTFDFQGREILVVRHDGHLWQIAQRDSVYWIWHRSPSGKTEDKFLSTVETQSFLVDLISSRLKLSDFWNGQTALPLNPTKNQ